MMVFTKNATPAAKISRLMMEKLVPVLLVRRSERVPSTSMFVAGFMLLVIKVSIMLMGVL